MNVDEMKNKISMELQNPITQQGFEIICKQLTEKDKQIEKMKNWCNCSNYVDCLRKRGEEGRGLKAKECHSCSNWKLKEIKEK